MLLMCLKYASFRSESFFTDEVSPYSKALPCHQQAAEKQQELLRVKEELHALQARWFALQEQDDHLEIEAALQDVVESDCNCRAATIQHKLVHCNGGFLRIPCRKECSYIHLTNYTPTPEEGEVRQLGLNCHIVESPKDG